MSDTSTDGTERDDGLKNPMRFSMRTRKVDMKEYLRHPDFDEKQVTEIVIRPSEGNVYVHWEWSVNTATEQQEGDYDD